MIPRYSHQRIVYAALLCALALLPVRAQQGNVTGYVYDNNGRLRAVIAPDGQAAVYDYDPAGNITALRRLTPDAFELLAFFPDVGKAGDMVTLRGIGFHTITAVSFNGAAAKIVRAEYTRLVAEVPQDATTGPITLISPRGMLTTPLPFTVRGVVVSPRMVSLIPGQKRQFTARVLPDESDQAVTWSVNGVVGGNNVFGMITASGEYTAPNALFSMITIRAASVADPELSDEALVMVGVTDDPARLTGFAVAYLSVAREQPPPPPQLVAAIAAGVSVGREPPPPPPPLAALSVNVSVGREPDQPPPTPVAAVSAPVSVGRDQPIPPTPVAAIGAGVSVGRDQPLPVTPVAAISAVVTASKGPLVTAVMPGSIARGAINIALTIRGENLNGASTIRFINAAGAADTSLTATNLTVGADGATLTATLNVNSNAAPGRRLIVVTTPGGNSQLYQTGQNAIDVTP